jgi:hypothetical protein
MKTWLAVAAVVALAVPAMAGAPDVNSAKAFVQKLYSHYPQKEGGPGFDPTGKNAAEVFDAPLIAAFKEDVKLAKGEVGYVDGDPICACQDDAGIKPKIVSAKMTGAATADVTVDIQFEGMTTPNLQTYKLVVVNGQWRIHDISSKEQKSYLDDITKANARHAKGDWAHD